MSLLAVACGSDTPAASGPESAPYGTLDFLGWEGYDTFFGANEAELTDLGINFNSTYMGAASDIAARFAGGGGDGLDLLAWTTANHRQFREIEGVLSPITVEEVPNLEGLEAIFADDTWGQMKDDNGDWLAIPFSFAPLGITYDQTKVAPKCLADLLAPEYEGLLGVPDIPPLHLQASAAALGYLAEDITPDQLVEVGDHMRPLFAQAKSLSPSFGDIIGLLASGEIVAAYGGYPGLGAFTENTDIVTVFPCEGTSGFVEVFSIPADADNRSGALAFINSMLDPETNAAINDAFAQATPVTDSIPLMSDANKALYPYDDIEGFLAENAIMSLPSGADGTIGFGDFIEVYGAVASGN